MTIIEITKPEVYNGEAHVTVHVETLLMQEGTGTIKNEKFHVDILVYRRDVDTFVNTVVNREGRPPFMERSNVVKHNYIDTYWAHNELMEKMASMEPVKIENPAVLDYKDSIQMAVTISLCGLRDKPLKKKVTSCSSCGHLYIESRDGPCCPHCEAPANTIPPCRAEIAH